MLASRARSAWRSASLPWSSSSLLTKTPIPPSWIATSCPCDTDPSRDRMGTGDVAVTAERARSAVLERGEGEGRTSLRTLPHSEAMGILVTQALVVARVVAAQLVARL